MASRSRIIIALQGVDGTGKSTQAALLAERLSVLGLPSVVIWNRWTPQAVGLVRRAVSGMFGSRDSEDREEQVTEDVAKAVSERPCVAYLFSRASWLEYLLQTRWRLLRRGRGASVVVLDRYVADMVVDRARRLGWNDDRITREVELAYRRGYPRPALSVFLDASPSSLIQRRPNEKPRALEERSALYRRVAALLDAPIIDAAESVESVAERIWEIVKASGLAERSIVK